VQLLTAFHGIAPAVDLEDVLLMIGKTLGHYQITSQLGKGNMDIKSKRSEYMSFIRLRSIAWHKPYARSAIIAALLLILPAVEIPAQDIKMVGPEKVGLSSERLARLDKAMREEIDQKRKAGIVVLIARRGSIAHFKPYGMADIESGVKMRTDHLFRLPSTIADIGETLKRLGFGLGVPVLLDPVSSGNLGSKGQIGGLAGAAGTFVIIDPREELISLFFTQYMPADNNIVNRFQTLVYQAIVD
jgi:CubicO group peptidase (beta-lactamase class C family)